MLPLHLPRSPSLFYAFLNYHLVKRTASLYSRFFCTLLQRLSYPVYPRDRLSDQQSRNRCTSHKSYLLRSHPRQIAPLFPVRVPLQGPPCLLYRDLMMHHCPLSLLLPCSHIAPQTVCSKRQSTRVHTDCRLQEPLSA